ncbi:MAG: hypothetical protein CMO01_16895 [Thalassobius sp.]|nr:hypothetical protein [Thalassovita sp.]
MRHQLIVSIIYSICICACTTKKYENTDLEEASNKTVDTRILEMNELFINSILNENLEDRLKYYSDEILCMPEFQLSMRGTEMIKTYYSEIFKREEVELLEKEVFEIIPMGKTLVEMGTFKKHYKMADSNEMIKLNGKYCNVWEIQPDEKLMLKAECWGYFHPVEKPESQVVDLKEALTEILPDVNNPIAFELAALNALMEKGVQTHDAALRSAFFTQDGMFLPFADSIKTGFTEINEHLIEYTSNNVSIDSIHVYNQGFEAFDDYVIEYPKFYVAWSLQEAKGISHGKGIRIWKRQADCTLKLYREIGLHNLN